MRTGILLLNFGEPENYDHDTVVAFLERIFMLNAPLMGRSATPEQVRERSRRLAEERAPGLIEEYAEIGGSPLHRQAREQAEALEAELRGRGHDVVTYLGMQFTEPTVAEAVSEALGAGIDRLIALPVYPLPGPSTTFAALQAVEQEMERSGARLPLLQLSGWHRHPSYVRFRAEAIRSVVEAAGTSLEPGSGTRLVFSAHGTPLKYLDEGSRYQQYVEDFCAAVAAELGVTDAVIGYQNHTNRPEVKWTQPDVEKVIEEIEADAVVVDPVSFMHEQSETLAELDQELREEAEERGLAFHRVPIRHAAPEFIGLLADLVEQLVSDEGARPSNPAVALRPCRCKQTGDTFCVAAPPRTAA